MNVRIVPYIFFPFNCRSGNGLSKDCFALDSIASDRFHSYN
jgi:hypothetical protein